MDYREARVKAEQIKRKVHAGESVTAAELDTLRQAARMNPTPDNIGLYSIAKRNVKEVGNEEEER